MKTKRNLKECENPDCSVTFVPIGRQKYCSKRCNPYAYAQKRNQLLKSRKGDFPKLDPNRKPITEIPCKLTAAQIRASKDFPYHLNRMR